MTEISESDIVALEQQAAGFLRAGDLKQAIGIQTLLVARLMKPGPRAFQGQPALMEHLEKASGELVDSLRWAREYERAIAIQETLVEYLPDLEAALRLGAANLRVESGTDEELGLTQIVEMADADPDNYWIQISLANACMYLERFSEAEEVLRRAVGMSHVRKLDRSIAQEYLYKLFERQGKTAEALGAWREAARLSSTLRQELLPDVCRMLIYWRKFDEARTHIAMEKVHVRKAFYQGLLAFSENKQEEAATTWRALLMAYSPANLKDGLEEYAETCLRMGNPAGVTLALESRMEAGQTSPERSILLGLAYAQNGGLERARWHFEIAMRLADLERPRLTMPAGAIRVFHIPAGILFAVTPLDPAVRKEIEAYFVPRAPVSRPA